jgi:hypothetical protein
MSENPIALKTWASWAGSEGRYANVKRRFLADVTSCYAQLKGEQ